MPETITVTVKNLQPNDYSLHGVPIVLSEGENLVRIDHWLVIKKLLNKKIEKGFVLINHDEETHAIEAFREECFSEFEELGIPSVKISSEQGELSKGVKNPIALEWLSSKSEFRELSREVREKEANNLARRSVAWAAISVLIAIIAIYLGNFA